MNNQNITGVPAIPAKLPPNSTMGLSNKTATTGPFGSFKTDNQRSRLRKMRSRVLTACRLHMRQKPHWKCIMITLTYAPCHSWEAGQLSSMLSSLRKYLKRRDVQLRHVWVLELTENGRPHYHLLIWVPQSIELPMPDAQGWWPWGMSKVALARNPVGYIAKYASKGDKSKSLPRQARMSGSGGLSGHALAESRWGKLPLWARTTIPKGAAFSRRKGGGYVIDSTGEVVLCPYRVAFQHGKVVVVMKDYADATLNCMVPGKKTYEVRNFPAKLC